MKNIIHCTDLYKDVEVVTNMVADSLFEPKRYGSEAKEFQFIPKGLQETFKSIVNEAIEIDANSGIFRKPNANIHYEEFKQHTGWLCIVALEDTSVKLCEHANGATTFFDVKDDIGNFEARNCYDTTHWKTVTHIAVKQNEFIFMRPWCWHALDAGKLVQVFALNYIVSQ